MNKAKIKKSKKVMTVSLPKPEVPKIADNIIAALMSLQASQGWAIIRKILDDNLKYLETAILEKIDPISKEKLTEKEIETLRIKRGLNIELRDTPQNYVKVVQEIGEAPIEYDPYYKTKEEIMKAGKKPPQDDRGGK